MIRSYFLACVFVLAHGMSANTAEPVKIEGRVLDRQQTPIAGATVSVINDQEQWECNTDADGHFALSIEPKAQFLFVRKEGFRFHGQVLPNRTANLGCCLTRLDEKPESSWVPHDHQQIRKECQELLGKVLEPIWKSELSGLDDRKLMQILRACGTIRPRRMMQFLEKVRFEDHQNNERTRVEVIKGLVYRDVDAALQIAETIDAPYGRCYALLEIVKRSGLGPDEKRARIAQAVTLAKSIAEPVHRIPMLLRAADELSRLGHAGEATMLVRDCEAEARELVTVEKSGYVRCGFAERMALFDFATARSMLLEQPDIESRNRHLGNAAHQLAVTNPSQARDMLDLIQQVQSQLFHVYNQRESYAARVCYRMARVDLEQAIEIANTCKEINRKAYCLGVIANAIAETKKDRSVVLLRQAYELLQSGINKADETGLLAFAVGGALLSTAERIDPGLVAEFFWTTLSLRAPMIHDAGYFDWSQQLTANLAIWLGQYDQRVAARIVRDWLKRPVDLDNSLDYDYVVAVIDPPSAVNGLQIRDEGSLSDRRIEVARALSQSLDARTWKNIPFQRLGLWPIDAEDFDW